MIDVVSAPVFWLGLTMLMVILEVIVPGYLFLGFSIGAALIALLVAVLPTGSLPQIPNGDLLLVLCWAIFSMAAWYALREYFKRKKKRAGEDGKDINEFNHRV